MILTAFLSDSATSSCIFANHQGVIKDIVHESGRGAPIAKIQFQNAYRFQRDNENMVAVEGAYSGQFIYAGKKGK